jgi:hypothetical protein
VTFYVWLSLIFHFFPVTFLLISTDQTCEPISMAEGSNNAFQPEEVPFWVPLINFEGMGSKTLKNPLNECVVYGFPTKLE